jgi:transcriptional regulator with XRE-family HTH domain
VSILTTKMPAILGKWLEGKEINRQELAEKIGVKRTGLAAYERGDAMIPLSRLMNLARELDVSPTDAVLAWLRCNIDAQQLDELVSSLVHKATQELEDRIDARQLSDIKKALLRQSADPSDERFAFWKKKFEDLMRVRLLYFGWSAEAFNDIMQRALGEVATIGDDALQKWEGKMADEVNSSDPDRSGKGSRGIPMLTGVRILEPTLFFELKKFERETKTLLQSGITMRFLLPATPRISDDWMDFLKNTSSTKLRPTAKAIEATRFIDLINDLKKTEHDVSSGFGVYEFAQQDGQPGPLMGIRYPSAGSLNTLLGKDETTELANLFDEQWQDTKNTVL